jgi:hypothetical protein
VRDEKEREEQLQEALRGLREVERQEKTKDEKAFKLSASAVQAMLSHDKKVEAAATKQWDGRVVELTAVSWRSHQDQRAGDHAGQTLFSFDLGEAGTGERRDKGLAVYFRDKDDIALLKGRKLGDKTPFRVRGELVVDYQRGFHVWVVSRQRCTAGRVTHSSRDQTWSARPAAIAGVRGCQRPSGPFSRSVRTGQQKL